VRALEQELKTLDLVIEAITKTTEAARQRVKPAVEYFMQQILPAITADRYKAVRLSDDYDVSIFVPDRGEFVQREVFSGGTEDQLLLAARIAFALSLLPRGKHTHPEFLFLDEPLGSSDKVRREGIMNLTRTILKETFQQIFIISHIPGLEEWADNIIELEDGRVVSSG
jgi:exonuclease SbcC